MKQHYTKLLSIGLMIGLGSQFLQTAQAHPYTKKTSSRGIKKPGKKVTPYRLRKKVKLTSAITNDNSDLTAENGIASWYGGRFQNRRTSSGAKLDNKKLTAAHPTLPLGSKVVVHSKDTGNSVIVTINDRGPFVKNRIIDLSKAAAAKIGMLHKGTAHVTVTPLTHTEVAEAPQ